MNSLDETVGVVSDVRQYGVQEQTAPFPVCVLPAAAADSSRGMGGITATPDAGSSNGT